MFQTHGAAWCSWQDCWLQGLKDLRDRSIYVLSGFPEFKTKFKSDETRRDEISFDPTYKLPHGKHARNILDWERIQFEEISLLNNLTIVHTARKGRDQGMEFKRPA